MGPSSSDGGLTSEEIVEEHVDTAPFHTRHGLRMIINV